MGILILSDASLANHQHLTLNIQHLSLAVTFCDLCMSKAFCGIETVRKWVLLNLWVLWEINLPSVREKPPQRVTCVSSHSEGVFYFSQIYTEVQNTQGFTETLSQPISQSVTANVSWKASVISVCRRRSVDSKRWWKSSVKSVSSVRERNTLCEKKEYPLCEKELPSMRERTP